MTESFPSSFPAYRPRRLRATEAIRRLVRESHFSLDQLIMPYFVQEGQGVREEIAAMPGQYRFSIDRLLVEIEEIRALGLRAILLFGVPEERVKDAAATAAQDPDGLVPRAVREIRRVFPDMLIITDVCLCAYTAHGHCGLLNARGEIDNDATLAPLARMAEAHASAGADMVAPSDMMDGRIAAIRRHLDAKGFTTTAILSYAAKFASAFYGPFRDAAHSAPQAGDAVPATRETYQMDPANREEALREIAQDIQEGADMVMVKPALAYLDIIRDAREAFRFPLAAYAVSGEYSMIRLAAEKGLLDERRTVLETLTAYIRAGASVVITYHARKIAFWHRESRDSRLESLISG